MRILLSFALLLTAVRSFQVSRDPTKFSPPRQASVEILLTKPQALVSTTSLMSTGDSDSESFAMSESDQTIFGAAGVLASTIMLYSEYTLKSTGCGLPAGPAGLLGAAEGVSYLYVVGLAGYSAFKKFWTGSGLPAGPGGILGAAEGLSFLAILAGVVVLGFQIVDYGYIPNAVPMEGGMCS